MPMLAPPARGRPAALAAVMLIVVLSAGGAWRLAQPAAAQPPDRAGRFGFVLGAGAPEQAQALGLPWHLTCCDPGYTPPAGTFAPRFLPIAPPLDGDTLTEVVTGAPRGTVWMIGNEPNVEDSSPPGYGNLSGDGYAQTLHYYDRIIRRIDSTAKLAGPNILNWDTTCNGCPGYPQGRAWTEAMRRAYLARYGGEPPLDIWTLHVYELDWTNFPNGNAGLNIGEIEAMRAWLDQGPGQRGKPLWLTEVGIHWGYPGMRFGEDGRIEPVGDYAYEHVERYMRDVFGWLDANAGRLNIERWFIWAAAIAVPEGFATAYGGIQLFDGAGPDAALTRLGRLYLQLAGLR